MPNIVRLHPFSRDHNGSIGPQANVPPTIEESAADAKHILSADLTPGLQPLPPSAVERAFAGSSLTESRGPYPPPQPAVSGKGGADTEEVVAVSAVSMVVNDSALVPLLETRARFALLPSPNPIPPAPESRSAANEDAPDPTATAISAGRELEISIGGATAVKSSAFAAGNQPIRDLAPESGLRLSIEGGEGNRESARLELRREIGPTARREQGSYGLTIESTGNSGGGLRDFGVFDRGTVFTDYLDVPRLDGAPARPWVMQYAIEGNCCSAVRLSPPSPIHEALPEWPNDLLAGHAGEMIVAFAVIDPGGVLENLRILQSPSPDLDRGLLDALEKWVFRPASIGGQPIAAKVLLGVWVAPND
ncbi:MAG TPA: TonB family protein [Candidatus Acidoferrales bacterium]|nr:TonB family protein [Candidatus Acidoferrales bacterium]